LPTVAVIARLGSPTLVRELLVTRFTAARVEVIVVLEAGALMTSCVRPTLALTGLPLIVASPLMVMLLIVAGVAPLA